MTNFARMSTYYSIGASESDDHHGAFGGDDYRVGAGEVDDGVPGLECGLWR